MKQQQATRDSTSATTTTPVEIEPTEFQPAYGRGGPVRSGEPERDWFFEDGAASASAKNASSSPEADDKLDRSRPDDRTPAR